MTRHRRSSETPLRAGSTRGPRYLAPGGGASTFSCGVHGVPCPTLFQIDASGGEFGGGERRVDIYGLADVVNGHGGAVGVGGAFGAVVGVEKFVVSHLEEGKPFVERGHFFDEFQGIGADVPDVHGEFGHAGAEAAEEEVVVAAAHGFPIGDEHGIVIDELVEGHGNGAAEAAGLVDGVGEGNDPVGTGFGGSEAEVPGGPVHEVGLAEHGVGTAGRMLGIVVFIRRHVADDVNVDAVGMNAVVEEKLVVFLKVAELEPRIEIALRSAVPMAHEGNLAFLPIAKAGAGEGDGGGIGGFLVDGEVGVERGRVGVVIAILVVKEKGIAEGVRGIEEAFHAVPATGDFGRRQGVGMLAVVAEVRPAGTNDEGLAYAGGLEVAKLLRALVEGEQLVVVGGVITVARRRLVMQDAHARLRQPDGFTDDGGFGDFLFQRDEEAGVHDVLAIAFAKGDVVALLKEAHAGGAQVAEAAKARQPARTDERGAAGRMRELIGGVVGGLDDDHHGGGAAFKTPPRHGPILDDMALDNAVVGLAGVAAHVGVGGAHGKIGMRPVARKKIAFVVAKDGVIHVAGIEGFRPIKSAQNGVAFGGGDVEHEVFVVALQAHGEVESEVELVPAVMEIAQGDFDASLIAGVVRHDGDTPGIGEAKRKFLTPKLDDHVVRAGREHFPFDGLGTDGEREIFVERDDLFFAGDGPDAVSLRDVDVWRTPIGTRERRIGLGIERKGAQQAKNRPEEFHARFFARRQGIVKGCDVLEHGTLTGTKTAVRCLILCASGWYARLFRQFQAQHIQYWAKNGGKS